MGIKLHDKKAGKQLLAWYDKNRRGIAWRALPGVTPDPYHVWLSEIMCQQTTVNAVIPYFLKFVKKWPDVHALANASQEQVMKEWAGLGYYARARNLHACAKIVSAQGGKFPDTQDELKKLPGIGDYTSAAIAAIAFGRKAVIVDGNVERVIARYFAIEEPVPKSKPLLKQLAGLFYDSVPDRHGDLGQAFMDLGATVCIPASPRCALCPLSKTCKGRVAGIAQTLPRKMAQKARPQKYGHVYWITDGKGRVLVHRRPQKGLLGGMAALPTSDWVVKAEKVKAPSVLKGRDVKSFSKNARIFHTFTHFDLQLDLQKAQISALKTQDYYWVERSKIRDLGFPTVFKKALDIFESGHLWTK